MLMRNTIYYYTGENRHVAFIFQNAVLAIFNAAIWISTVEQLSCLYFCYYRVQVSVLMRTCRGGGDTIYNKRFFLKKTIKLFLYLFCVV